MACSPVLPRLLRRRATSLTSMSMETGRELIPQALHGRRGVGANASAEPAPASSTSERRREGISLRIRVTVPCCFSLRRPAMPRVDFGVLTLPRKGLSLGFGFHGDLQNKMNEHEDPLDSTRVTTAREPAEDKNRAAGEIAAW